MSKKPTDLPDVRTIERDIKHGAYTRKDVEKLLDTLPDVTGKGVTLGTIEAERAARAGK